MDPFSIVILAISSFSLGAITTTLLIDKAIRHNIRRGVISIRRG